MTICHTATDTLGDVNYFGTAAHLSQQAYSDNYGTEGDVRCLSVSEVSAVPPA